MKKVAVLALGRLNPPTLAHELLVNTMAEQQGDHYLYLSHTHDSSKNPLDYETKLMWCRKAFNDKVVVKESDARNMYEAAAELNKQGYTDLIYVCGSDRAEEAARMRNYNGESDKNGNIIYNFDSINFITAGGERINEDDLPIEAVSASKQREFAANGDLEDFIKYCPSRLTDYDKEELYYDVRKGMGLFESLEELSEDILDEAEMKSDDIIKHDNKYYLAVLNDLGTTGVKLKDGSIKTVTNRTILNKLKNLVSVEDKGERVQEFNDLAGFSWTKIDKSVYSGKGGDNGQSAGENAEPIVCGLYNNPSNKTLLSKLTNDAWVKSTKDTVDLIRSNWSNKEYVAAHVNGRDMVNIPDNAKAAGRIFKSKQDAAVMLGLDSNAFNDLYDKGFKDNWNKADMILIRKGFDLIAHLKRNKITDSNSFNDTLTQYILSEDVVPISLKKIVENPKISKVGFDVSPKLRVKNVTVDLPKEVDPNTNNCTVWLIANGDTHSRIQFRRQSDTIDNLSIEIVYPNARGGKAISKVKNSLGVTGNGWYSQKIRSKSELINELDSIFDNVIYTSEPKGAIKGDKYPWYNRTCFRGLLATYKLYNEKTGGNCRKFFEWIYNSASTGTSPFYLINS